MTIPPPPPDSAPPPDPSAAWLAAWGAGDRRAGRAFYEAHAARVVRFFELKVDDPTDFVQRTFLRVLEAARRGGPPIAHPRAYVLTVARRLLVDHLRGRPGAPADLDAITIAGTGTSPTQRIARREEEQALLEALTALPLDDQIALELHYWEGLSTREAASILGVGRSAVLSRLHRARTALRTRLASAGTAAMASRGGSSGEIDDSMRSVGADRVSE